MVFGVDDAICGSLIAAGAGLAGGGIKALTQNKQTQAEKDLANIHTTTPGVTDFGTDLSGQNDPNNQRLSFQNNKRRIIFPNYTG